MAAVIDYRCYSYNKEWYLVELMLDKAPSEIDWSKFIVPEENKAESSWQCAYMEQYLNDAGTARIADTYSLPERSSRPCRATFFIFKTAAKKLQTPYGILDLTDSVPVPERLKNIIEFSED